ncbi:hypothetical protein SFUMM280S_01396 [Streptomyces fumanus]
MPEAGELLLDPSAAELARALGDRPDLLPLLLGAPTVVEDLSGDPRAWREYAFGEFLAAQDGPPERFETAFEAHLARRGVLVEGDYHQRVREVARGVWDRFRAEREALAARRDREIEERLAAFDPRSPHTWTYSGAVVFAGVRDAGSAADALRQALSVPAQRFLDSRADDIKRSFRSHALQVAGRHLTTDPLDVFFGRAENVRVRAVAEGAARRPAGVVDLRATGTETTYRGSTATRPGGQPTARRPRRTAQSRRHLHGGREKAHPRRPGTHGGAGLPRCASPQQPRAGATPHAGAACGGRTAAVAAPNRSSRGCPG